MTPKLAQTVNKRERERERDLSIQPALAYEDVSMLESSTRLSMAAQQWQTAFWSWCHMNDCMTPSASRNSDPNCQRICTKCELSKTKCRSLPIACVSHNVHRRKCRGTTGLASLPCSTGKEWEPIRNVPFTPGMLTLIFTSAEKIYVYCKAWTQGQQSTSICRDRRLHPAEEALGYVFWVS